MARARALRLLPGRYAVCRLPPDAPAPAWVFVEQAAFWSVSRTPEELSVVCDEDALPPSVARAETGWRALQLEGPIPFHETGVLAEITAPLAQAGIPIFALSTHDTDIVMVKDRDLARAIQALRPSHWIEEG